MNTGAFGENFPYSNFHDLNMDWIIKIAKDFLDQYTHIQEVIENGETSLQNLTTSGLEQLQTKADALEALLQAWYDTHSADIANQLAEALADLTEWYSTHSQDIANELTTAISTFTQRANAIGESVIASIPADYTELSNKVDTLEDIAVSPDAIVDLKNPSLWRLGTIQSTGNIIDAHTSDNIYTARDIAFPVRYRVATDQQVFIAKYLNGVFVSRNVVSGGVINMDNTFDSYRIMVLFLETATGTRTVEECVNAFDFMQSKNLYLLTEYTDTVNEILEKLDLLFQTPIIDLKTPSLWTLGTIQADGTLSPTHGSDNIYTNYTFNFPVRYRVDSDQAVYIGKYLNRQWVGRSAVSGGTINLDSTFDSYRIMVIFLNTPTGSRTVEECVNAFDFMDSEMLYEIKQYISKDTEDYLLKLVYANTGGKICHYSIDDTYHCLQNLIDNSNTYTSIFDEPFLSELKRIHDNTDLCITLNCFNVYGTFNITNLPQNSTFRTEFTNNANWLKFAFHSRTYDTDYSQTTEDILTDYNTFVTSIYNLTGSYDCIDSFTRLNMFSGNLSNVLAIHNAQHGITGLLGADTVSRASYYLDASQNSILQTKGLYVDYENRIIFIKTITRGLSTAMKSEIENNLLYQKYIECFSHEQDSGIVGTIETMATWLKDNGYRFAFPSKLFE